MAPKLYAAELLAQPTQITPDDEMPPTKKPRTEKQVAALEKAKQARADKKAQVDAMATKQQEAAELARQQQANAEMEKQRKIEEQLQKKELQKEKRRAARVAKKVDSSVPDLISESSKEDVQPPAWFNKYIQGVKTEQSMIAKDHKPKKQIKIESNQAATDHWNEPLTRDRVTHEVDNHLNRMYSQIFAGR